MSIAQAQSRAASNPDELNVNTFRLRSLGIVPEQAKLLSKTAHFVPGKQRIGVFLNGVNLGQLTGQFNSEGQLCVEEQLLERGHIVPPTDVLLSAECRTFSAVFPDSVVELRPSKSDVFLVLPMSALYPPEQRVTRFERGGSAALLNYDAFVLRSDYGSRSNAYKNLNTVAGFNAGDWLFRSSQIYTASNQNSQVTHLYAYGQRTFSSLASTVQAGQITTSNSVFSGIAFSGVQLLPEDSLRATAAESPVKVEGVANSAARVQVHQNGVLVHTTIVPAGPFSLTDLALNRQRDVEVTVIENSGARSGFILPAAGLASTAFNATPGYSFAVGQYRSYGNQHIDKPLLLTASGTWPISAATQLDAGVLGTQDYQGAAATVGYQLGDAARLSVSQQVSNSSTEGKQGTSASVALNTQLSPTLSLGLSTQQNTQGYRDFQDTLQRYESFEVDFYDDFFGDRPPKKIVDRYKTRTRDQYGASLGWRHPLLGSMSVSTSYANRFDGQGTQYVSGAWSKMFGKTSVSFNLQKSTGGREYGNDQGLSSYLTVSMPFGTQTRVFMNTDKQRSRSGASYSDNLSDGADYQVQVDHEDRSHQTNLTASTNLMSRYARTLLGYSRSSQDFSSYNGRISGAVVAHGNGVTLSPYAVDDTFSIISVGKLSGVKVITPRGPVWTDPFGQAVATGLAPHRESQLAISGDDLPRNVDIGNSVKKITAGRGSVQRVEFDVSVTRRVLLKVTGPEGKPLPRGLVVLDEHEQYITQSLAEGKLYFAHLDPDQVLNVRLPGGKTCSMNYTLPKQAHPAKVMETLNATCTTL